MARLNAVLTRDEFYCPQAVAVIRLLMLTGCRRGEVVSLEWGWIPNGAGFAASASTFPIRSQGRARSGCRAPRKRSSTPSRATAPIARSCFRRVPPTRHIDNFEYQWHRIRNEAGLPGLRIHDLRHNWASVAAMNGVDMVTVARLLGHALVETTERYTHLSGCGPGRKRRGTRERDEPCPALTRARAAPARPCRGTGRRCSSGSF